MSLAREHGADIIGNTHLHTTAADRLLQTADIAGVIDAAPEGPRILTGDLTLSV